MKIDILAKGLTMAESYQQMKTGLILLAVICLIMIAASVVFYYLNNRIKAAEQQSNSLNFVLLMLCIATALIVICTTACFFRYRAVGKDLMRIGNDKQSIATENSEVPNTTPPQTEVDMPETIVPSFGIEDTKPIPKPTFKPQMVDSTNPDNWGIQWEIRTNGSTVKDYNHKDKISFGEPEEYFALPGISTFRGNNYRNGPAYGTVTVTEKVIKQVWGKNVGALNGWPGCGWTGQPLMVQWDDQTKKIMNLYDNKKEKEGLVEVIYATLVGSIYFYDLEDGSYTRDPIYVGMNFKGAGSLDPRGYPIMYVGSGDYIGAKAPRMYMISLIDGTILYQSDGTDNESYRAWNGFDSAPLVDAETDTLIWPGENGVLYTIKLNTKYDKEAGTLSIQPETIVKTRYSTGRSNQSTYWLGYEPSAVIVDRYLYISENGGMFFCVDLDTMKLVWAQDTRDDSNSTPVFEPDGQGGGYIYTAPSLHWTAQKNSGYICIYKLDAKTGEIIWEKRFDCTTESGVSGGVQSTPILGKPGTELEGLILYTVARNPSHWEGKLVALDTATGEIVWEKHMNAYSWSSPVAVYDETGTAYIILCDSVGNMFLLDSKGTTLSQVQLGSNIEASPAVFNDMIVVGTRGGLVSGIKIK